jgi:DNA replication protein DnaC
MRGLEPLGDARLFRDTLRRIQGAQTEGTLAELIAMQALPSVDEVRDELAAVRGEIATLPGEAEFDLDRIKLGRRVTDLEQQLALCQRRDRIAASRPPGCWCLGAGGEGERGILPAGRFVGDGAEPFETFARYCTCQEGADAERAAHVAQHAHDRWVIDSRRQRIWGKAKVPSIYDGLTLETWIEEVVRRGGNREQVTTLVRGLRRWLETTAWLLLIGPVSTGKTGIAIALMWELAGRGIPVFFVNASDMVMRIKGTFDRPDQSEVEMFDSLAEVPVLVIDDLGKQAMTPYAMELFYRLFNARWGNGRRTIVTSNLAKTEALKAHVGEAVYDRLIQVVKVAPVDPGVNLRAPRRAIAALS